MPLQALCIIPSPSVNSNWSCSPETLNSGQNHSTQFFSPCDLEIWWMTSKNNRAPLLCYFKLCALFHSYLSIQTGVTVQIHSIWVKIFNFLACVTLKFDRWPWKTIGYLFYATSSFVDHFIVICELKLGLPSWHAKFGSKLSIFRPMWPWNLTDDLEFNRVPLLCHFKLLTSLTSNPDILHGHQLSLFLKISW